MFAGTRNNDRFQQAKTHVDQRPATKLLADTSRTGTVMK